MGEAFRSKTSRPSDQECDDFPARRTVAIGTHPQRPIGSCDKYALIPDYSQVHDSFITMVQPLNQFLHAS